MKKRWLSILLALSMTVSMLAGCGSSQAGNESEAGKSEVNENDASAGAGEESGSADQEVAYEDLPTLNVLFVHEYTYEGDENVVWKELAMKVGAKIHFIGADTDKYNTMVASGEGYDLLMAFGANMNDLALGGSLLPMEDLMSEYGSNITQNIPVAVEYSKENISGGSGQLYWLPYGVAYTGSNVGAKSERQGQIRWDYYKEMGYPETNSVDEYLLMIKDMQELHPTTEDGSDVYGMCIPSDKLLWSMQFPFSRWLGQSFLGSTGCYNWKDMSYVNFFDEEGTFWYAIDYYHKANELGLLDPDSFTITEEDMSVKAADGKLLTINADWQTKTMGANQGFATVPKSWANPTSSTVGNVTKGLGTPAWGYAINKNTEYPELCMKYLDFIYSEEGANLIYNGIEGTHYVVEDGVRSLTAEALEMYNAPEGEEWEETGLYFGQTENFSGLNKGAITSDGKSLCLVFDSSLFANTLTDVEKDLCEHYGVSYPQEIVEQFKVKYGNVDEGNVDPYVLAFLPRPTDEIKQLETALCEEAESWIADLIFASDDEYASKVADAKERFEKIGLQKVNEYYESNWEQAFDKAEQYK